MGYAHHQYFLKKQNSPEKFFLVIFLFLGEFYLNR